MSSLLISLYRKETQAQKDKQLMSAEFMNIKLWIQTKIGLVSRPMLFATKSGRLSALHILT